MICGNIYQDRIIDDLIEDVGIDALHSFQDEIMPVVEFKKRYGANADIIGGVDFNILVSDPEEQMRMTIRRLLNECQEEGRYALGSGNSLAR